jgi:hypothetical protein
MDLPINDNIFVHGRAITSLSAIVLGLSIWVLAGSLYKDFCTLLDLRPVGSQQLLCWRYELARLLAPGIICEVYGTLTAATTTGAPGSSVV